MKLIIMYEGLRCSRIILPSLKDFHVPWKCAVESSTNKSFTSLPLSLGPCFFYILYLFQMTPIKWIKDWLLAIMLHAASSYHLIAILPNNRLGLVIHFPLLLSGCSQHPTLDISLMETIPRSHLEICTYAIANASFLQL